MKPAVPHRGECSAGSSLSDVRLSTTARVYAIGDNRENRPEKARWRRAAHPALRFSPTGLADQLGCAKLELPRDFEADTHRGLEVATLVSEAAFEDEILSFLVAASLELGDELIPRVEARLRIGVQHADAIDLCAAAEVHPSCSPGTPDSAATMQRRRPISGPSDWRLRAHAEISPARASPHTVLPTHPSTSAVTSSRLVSLSNSCRAPV